MAKPTKAEIKSKAIKGLIDLAKMDSGEFWYDLAAELLPSSAEDEKFELARAIHNTAVELVEDMAKPKPVGVLGVSRPRR